MGKFINKKNFVISACMLLSLFIYSCQDDLFDAGTEQVEEGLPATVTLKIKVNDMDLRSRSTIADEASAHYCNNIWIGLYSKEDGKRIDYFYYDDLDETQEVEGEYYKLNLKTESRNGVYIVAVANSDVNSGISSIDGYGTETESTTRAMLDSATTFDKFKTICVLRPDAKDVNIYANTLTMSGWYADDVSEATDPADMKAVNIAGGLNALQGAVFLRKIISYNKFVIVPGQYINLTLNTWKVCNIPAGSYLFEQPGTKNIADDYTGSTPFYNNSNASRLFTATTTDEGESGQYFEFYQVENKHVATDYAADGTDHVGIDPNASDWYNEREREFKTTNDDNTTTNQGIYRSLVKSDKSNIANNNASYVVVNASIDYYVKDNSTDDADFDPTTAEPCDPSYTGKKIHRTANINYTIHLGYCDKDDNGNTVLKTAQDFNCYRNTKYTYKVTINGVKNVVVEAHKVDETQPGTDGWVSDETGSFIELDSHYCEFNISLSDKERENMSYRITSPYDGNYYYYSRDKDGNYSGKDIQSELYSWIKFYPTKDRTTLAKYNGGKGENSLGEGTGLWTFDNMCSPSVTPSPYDADSDGNKWYTVFIDEYVYHFDDEGDVETSWPKYVNQDDRMAEFIMNEHKSTDTESEYSYCKYAFSQKSIQTYYKGVASDDGTNTAIGVEHTEETYCLNMNWKYFTNPVNFATEYSSGVWDHANGRWNLYHYVDSLQKTWSDVIQETVPAHVMAGSYRGTSHPEADYSVYMPGDFASRPGNCPTSGDSNAYYANSICMNRNRDLDGDNDIDTKEMRWFLPPSSIYMQIATAQSELPDPIIRFTDHDPNMFVAGWLSNTSWPQDRYGTYNYHYITSDYQYFWAEQGVNTGDFPWNGYNGGAETATHTARCVRNLGTNPANPPVKDVREVGYAYTYDSSTRIFSQNNFVDAALRGYTLGGLAPHDTSSPTAKPYKKFEVAKDWCYAKDDYFNLTPKISTLFTLSERIESTHDPKTHELNEAWTKSLEQNSLCGKYYQDSDKSQIGTWRIPSAYELALMWSEGMLKTDGNYCWSSTYDYFTSWETSEFSDYNSKYLGYNCESNRQVLALDIMLHYSDVRVRCVRDVR
jgi:hypothetical protein